MGWGRADRAVRHQAKKKEKGAAFEEFESMLGVKEKKRVKNFLASSGLKTNLRREGKKRREEKKNIPFSLSKHGGKDYEKRGEETGGKDAAALYETSQLRNDLGVALVENAKKRKHKSGGGFEKAT